MTDEYQSTMLSFRVGNILFSSLSSRIPTREFETFEVFFYQTCTYQPDNLDIREFGSRGISEPFYMKLDLLRIRLIISEKLFTFQAQFVK